MPSKIPSKPEPRGVKIPINSSHWWPERAMRVAVERARARGIRAPGIRDLTRLLNDQGVDCDEDTVGRCLRGEIVTWEVAIPLSKILGIPAPVIMPETPEEAALLESGDEIRALLDKLRRIG